MAVNLSPVAGAAWQFFDANGKPLNGGLLNTYTAGTTTPQPTFTTSAGSVQNSNPIVLGADGRTPQEIWLTSGIAYKFVLTDSLLNLIGTYDNIMGINDVSTSLSQWIATNLTPTFVSPTQFTVPGDQTLILTVGRRVQLIETAGTVVGVITAVAFTTITTVTVQFETTNVVDSGLSTVSYSLLTSVADPIPRGISVGPEISVASATSTPIGGAGSSNVLVTGTTTITSFDTVTAGIIRYVRFNGVLTLTNGAALLLPGAQNIPTASGDIGIFRSAGAGNWVCIDYQAIAAGALGTTQTLVHKGLVDISATGAGQIAFPASQNASAGANTLDDYREATFTSTYTGYSTTVNETIPFTKIGNSVAIMYFQNVNAVSNATTKTITGIPAAIQATRTINVFFKCSDNGGNFAPADGEMTSGSGTLVVSSNLNAGAWTASGNAQIDAFPFSYTLA